MKIEGGLQCVRGPRGVNFHIPLPRSGFMAGCANALLIFSRCIAGSILCAQQSLDPRNFVCRDFCSPHTTPTPKTAHKHHTVSYCVYTVYITNKPLYSQWQCIMHTLLNAYVINLIYTNFMYIYVWSSTIPPNHVSVYQSQMLPTLTHSKALGKVKNQLIMSAPIPTQVSCSKLFIASNGTLVIPRTQPTVNVHPLMVAVIVHNKCLSLI